MADIVLENGNTLDDAIPRADTLVIRHDRIAYVGGADGAAQYRAPRTEVLDLQGKTLVPGFNDNHLHAVSAGDYFSRPILLGLNADQIIEKLKAAEKDRQRVRNLRFRLEHAQLIAQEDLPRLADWGILLAVQPSALIDLKKDQGLLGEERANRAYPYQSILNAGISLSFGSDVPGESKFEPLELIHLAVNRNNGENVTPLQALCAYTKGSAYAEFMESEKGTLTPGKLADCVVLSEDPTTCPPDKIKDIRVEATIIGGRIVFKNN